MDTVANFPNATPAEWKHARGVVYYAALRSGIDANEADDLAQQAMLVILRRRFRTPVEGPVHAARIIAKGARRLGWHTLQPSRANSLRRSATRAEEGMQQVIGNAIARSVTPSPADMAEQAERRGVSVHRVHEAYGVGGYALAEPNTTPSVYAAGPATLPPVEGSRLWKLETDPNPERTLAATHPAANPPQWRTGADLDHYREQMAAYYGPRPVC